MDISELEKRCYAPYSGRHTVCVAESHEGHFYPGIRIENASFPLTIDAVQSAVFCCISEGAHPKAVYTVGDTGDGLAFWCDEYNLQHYPLQKLLQDEFAFTETLIPRGAVSVEEHLKLLLKQAKADYSDFPVAALLETPEGFVSGVNIECSDWSRGLCAERVAIAKAMACGITDFQALHIHTLKGEFSSPCGACRQVISEHFSTQPVHLHHPDGSRSTHFPADLLPYSFHSTTLKKDTL